MKKIYISMVIIACMICMMLTSCQATQGELNFNEESGGQGENDDSMSEQKGMAEVPIIYIDGSEIIVGETRLQKLLDIGYVVKFTKDNNLYDISTEDKIAEPGYNYSVQLYKDDKLFADMVYSNDTEENQSIGECSIDSLSIYLMGDYADAQVSVDGHNLRSISIDDVMSLYSGYKKANTTIPTYRLTTTKNNYNYIATIQSDSESNHAISNYTLTKYQN